MPQEMSFAQALNEARQIIMQQSNRIKADLDRIKALQENVNSLTGTVSENERQLRQKGTDLDVANELLKGTNTKLEETRIAREQGEAVIDRQGQRLSQMQETIANLEKQLMDQSQKHEETHRELETVRASAPTQEDNEALAALASLLSAKKGAPAKAPDQQGDAAAA